MQNGTAEAIFFKLNDSKNYRKFNEIIERFSSLNSKSHKVTTTVCWRIVHICYLSQNSPAITIFNFKQNIK